MQKVVRLHDNLIVQKIQDYEQYAFLYSKSVAEDIFCEDDQHIENYVKIQYGSNKVYRKCAAFRTVKANEISLGNRTIRELGLQKEQLGIQKLEVKKMNWFAYQLHNSDLSQRVAFIIVLVGLLCSIFSTSKDIIEILFAK